ncbi:hypothetical protein [Catenuloplanes indicus]|uniref:Uncharacterized protein n=1 Tax=Catenuloplanes indicus TaxID=137267 RepID=A0AAE3W4A2_9ACTN|nr:hypothetical protein [Catenuloplanes indicus]MDQ0369306.1 hypothetical protein [Catenuloplanes indicus]
MDSDDLFAAREAAWQREAVRRKPVDDDVPGWVRYPARAIALVFVVPIRFLWEIVKRTVLLIGAALSWAGVYLFWLPLRWVWLNIIWLPLRWVWLNVIWPPVRWTGVNLIGKPLRWLFVHLVALPVGWVTVTLIYRPLRWLARALRPAASAVLRGLAWTVEASWSLIERWVFRPIGWALRVLADALAWAWRHSAVPFGRGIAWLWRHTVVPVARGVAWIWSHTVTPVWRFVRDDVWRPIADATRDVLRALSGR